MRTKLISLLLLVSISLISSAQDNLDKIIHVWGKDFWGMSPISVDHSGNIYLSGVFADTVFFGSKDNWLVNMDSSDFFITKIYPDGTMAWTKVITGMGSETFQDIEVDKNENVYIIGQFDQTMIIDTYSYDTYGLFESIWTGDHFLCKLDPDGNLVDLRRGSENGENLIFRAIELDANGEICLIGQTKGDQVFDFQFEPIVGHWRSFMVKVDNSFDAEWIISLCDSADIQNPGICFYHAVVSDQFNNIYISGRVDASPNNSIYISKVDQDGSLLWMETIASSEETGIRDVFVDKNNDVYMISYSSTIAKYSDEGEYIWSIDLESDLSTCIVNRDGFTVAAVAGDWPLLNGLIIIDPNGEILYQHTFDYMEIHSLALDEAGNVYFNGYFQEEFTLGDQVVSPLNSTNYVFGLLNVSEMISSSNTEYIKQYDTYKLYPNPTTNTLTIESEKPDQHSIEIISLSGQLIFRTEMEGNSKQINLSLFSKGIYFVTVRSKEFVRTEKVVKL